MTEVSTSIYNQPPPKPFNPLETMSQVTGIQNALIQNKLLQQEQSGKEALKNAYTLDPRGGVDYAQTRAKLLSSGSGYLTHQLNEEALSANQPQEYFDKKSGQTMRVPAQNFAGVMNPAGNRVPGQSQPGNLLQQGVGQRPQLPPKPVEEIDAAHQHLDATEDEIQKLEEKPDLSEKDIINATANLIADGRMNPSDGVKAWSSIPHGQNGQPASSEQLRRYVKQSLASLRHAKKTLTSTYGAPSTRMPDQNGSVESGIQSMPASGQSAPLSNNPQQSSPQSPAQQQPADDQFGVPAGPALGHGEYIAGLAHGATDRAQGNISAAKDARNMMYTADKIYDLSSKVSTGPGQDWQNDFIGKLSNIPGLSMIMDKGKDYSSNVSELQKYMVANATRAWEASGGTGSNAQLDTFAHMNPNSTMFPQAVKDMSIYTKSLAMMNMGKANAQDKFLAGDNTPEKQMDFENKFRNIADPEAYTFWSMPPEAGKAYLKKMPKAHRIELLHKIQKLEDIGALPSE